jgi:hypothetical protein
VIHSSPPTERPRSLSEVRPKPPGGIRVEPAAGVADAVERQLNIERLRDLAGCRAPGKPADYQERRQLRSAHFPQPRLLEQIFHIPPGRPNYLVPAQRYRFTQQNSPT